MNSALESLVYQIMHTPPVEQPEGLVCVIYEGRKGVRLVVDPVEGRAVASLGDQSRTVINRDPAVAARRALSYLITGGVAS